MESRSLGFRTHAAPRHRHETAATVREMMEGVVLEGTGKPAQL